LVHIVKQSVIYKFVRPYIPTEAFKELYPLLVHA